MEIYLLNLSNEPGLLYNSNVSKFVTKHRMNRISRLRFESDKKVLLYAELLLRKIIEYRTGLPASTLQISLDSFGKPHLIDVANLEFSISHTRKIIALAIDSYPLGIDIESTVLCRDYLRIVNHFALDEQQYVNAGNDNLFRFLELWTKKEAYLKALGIGLQKNLSSFTVLDKSFLTFLYNENLLSVFSETPTQYTCARKVIVSEENINNYYLQGRFA